VAIWSLIRLESHGPVQRGTTARTAISVPQVSGTSHQHHAISPQLITAPHSWSVRASAARGDVSLIRLELFARVRRDTAARAAMPVARYLRPVHSPPRHPQYWTARTSAARRHVELNPTGSVRASTARHHYAHCHSCVSISTHCTSRLAAPSIGRYGL
jgi:hypothetical protein